MKPWLRLRYEGCLYCRDLTTAPLNSEKDASFRWSPFKIESDEVLSLVIVPRVATRVDSPEPGTSISFD
jgi:hypothetical protein